MAGGQSVDVEWTGKTMTPETLDFIYRLKTGALIEASLMIGAILAGGDEAAVRKAERLGAAVGYAFQIRDDILGATSTTEKLGKTVGLDEQNGKTTYVTLYGLEAAQMKVHELTDEAETLLKELSDGRPSAVLSDLIASLADRNN